MFLGLDFKKDGAKTLYRLFNRRRDENGRLTDGFEYSKDKNSTTVIKIFKDRLEDARKRYRERPSGMIEDEVRSIMSDDSAWSTATEGSRGSEATGDTVQRNPDQDEDDNQSQGTVVNNQDQEQDEDQGPLGDVVRFNRDSEEVSIERQQENRGLAEVIEEEIEQTKFEVIEEVENDMQGNRDNILARFAMLVRDNKI